MSVLIIRKITNYELYGEAVEARAKEGLVKAETLGRLKSAHDEHYTTLDDLRENINKLGLKFKEVGRDEKVDAKAYEHVFTVGGDGTLLSASHSLPQSQSVLGIRSSASSVGYLCGASFDTLAADLRRYFDGLMPKITVQRIQAQVQSVKEGRLITSVPVLNDILFSNISPAATTRYSITHNDKVESHRSSGIWISTPIGSTAAIHTAGGIKMPPEDLSFQFKVRELYKMGLRIPKIEGATFDPDKEELTISNRCQQAILALDGQHGEIPLEYGDEIKFARAEPLQIYRRS